MNKLVLHIFLFSLLCLKAQKKPNVIVIMSDDMGNNLASVGNPWLKTPNVDRLHNQSIRLTNFHQAIMCTPSRTAMMTGKYSLRTGAWRTSVGRSHMRTEETTIAEVFKENGYATGQFGKWHLGDVWPFRASDQGFDESVNFKCGGISQISDYWGNDYFDDTYYHNDKPQKYEGYCTDVFFSETMRFIKETKDEKPFMVYLAPNVAHLPAIVADKYAKPWLEKGHNKKQSIFYGMITNLDENMGRLMHFLEAEGIADNTILVFTTDDGTAGYAAQFDKEGWPLKDGFNMGQRGGKGAAYEGGHRVFSYIKWSGGALKGGTEMKQLSSVMDVFPTLLDLCQIESKKQLSVDGISFKDGLYGKAIKGNKERTICLSKLTPEKPLDFKRNKYCVIEGDWRYVNRKELYNVKNDRAQCNNVYDSHPDIIADMEEKLQSFLKKNAQDRETPVRFVLGDKNHKKIDLTAQDLWGNSVFTQGQVEKHQKGSGPWKVQFINSGKYQITLSRYPLHTGYSFSRNKGKKVSPFTAKEVILKVVGNEYSKKINTTDSHITFEVEIAACKTDLETFITSMEGITIPAYYVSTELVN